jgi:hypothetical protein
VVERFEIALLNQRQQHPIADLEHPFALINTRFIAKGCSKVRIGDG